MVETPLRIVVAILAFLSSSSLALAEPTYVEVGTVDLKQALGTKSDWHVTTYGVEGGEDAIFGDNPGKFCFWRTTPKTSRCRFAQHTEPDGHYTRPFQSIGTPSIVRLMTSKEDRRGVMIGAGFSAGGSGTAEFVSLWSYDRSSDDFSELLEFQQDGIGEFKILNREPMNGYVVKAEFIWFNSEGESHFSDHRYSITVWRYNPAERRYLQVLQYVTNKKYPGGDTPDPIDVITPELSKIQRLLKTAYPSSNFVR